MNCQIRSGATSTPTGDSRNGVAIFLPGPFRAFCVSTALVSSALLAGCGGGGDAAPLQGETDPAPSSQTINPIETEAPGDSAGNDADDDAAFESSTVGADVLLIVPAGRVELPQTETPAIQFSSLAEISPTQSLGATLRAASRNPVTADGGRSGTLNTSGNEGQTGSVTVSWDPPLENADGSSVADLAGYRVYQGNSQQLTIIQELNETGAGERRLTQINNVSPDNACFAVTAVDTSSNESALGDVVCKDIIVAPASTNSQAPNLTSVTQLDSTDGVANVRLTWVPPASSVASAGASVTVYSIYHGSQSQLFKISEQTPEGTRTGSNHQYDVNGISGAQACFALTARFTDGLETVLGEIVCIPLVHTAAPQPGNELRPFSVSATMVGASNAEISWNRPNTVVSSADATGIDRYDLYQGSRSQVYKVGEIKESGAAGIRRTTAATNVFPGSNCFALTATDESRRQSALSTIVCATLPVAGTDAGTGADTGTSTTPEPEADGSSIGVSNINAQETSPGSVAVTWDAPGLIAVGQPISNLFGYNIYQGSESQLFKVSEQRHVNGVVRQQVQRTEVTPENSCFAITAFDSNGFEAPLSEIVCAKTSGTASVPVFGIVPPTEISTSALGGSSTVKLSWLASGSAASGAADPNVHLYNIYQGNHDRLFKVREVNEDHDADPRSSTTFTSVAPNAACFAITAQYRDLRESRLSDIVCREN